MENKKAVPAGIDILMIICSLVCIVGTVYSMVYVESLSGFAAVIWVISCVLVIIELGLALVYSLAGYKKDSARYFHWFGIGFALIGMVSCLMGEALVVMVFQLISFGCACILAVAKDLGKVKSYVLVGVTVLCSLVLLVIKIFVFGTTIEKCGPIVGVLIITIIYGIMVMAKYMDKDSRGTK